MATFPYNNQPQLFLHSQYYTLRPTPTLIYIVLLIVRVAGHPASYPAARPPPPPPPSTHPQIYLVLLIVRVVLSYFRNISWGAEPLNTLRQFTDPYLSNFREIVQPIAGVDLSPVIGFVIIAFLARVLHRVAAGAPLI